MYKLLIYLILMRGKHPAEACYCYRNVHLTTIIGTSTTTAMQTKKTRILTDQNEIIWHIMSPNANFKNKLSFIYKKHEIAGARRRKTIFALAFNVVFLPIWRCGYRRNVTFR